MANAEGEAYMTYMIETTAHGFLMEHTANLLNNHLRSFMVALQQLRNGKLSPYLVPPLALQAALRHVHQTLETQFQGLHMVHPHVNFYYRSARFAYARTGKHLLLTLQIPLSKVPDAFDVFAIHQHDLIVSSTSSHAMRLLDIPSAVAIAESRKYYAELSETEMQLLLHSPHEQVHIYRHVTRDNCLMSIFNADHIAVNLSCHYKVVTDSLKPGIVHVQENLYALTAVPKYNLSCLTQFSTLNQSLAGCESCIIKIPSTCTYEDGVSIVPASLERDPGDRYGQQHMSRAIVPIHQLNLALLSKFFNEERIDQLASHNFLRQPARMIPDLKFYEANLSHRFAADEKTHLDLDKVVRQVKTNGIVMSHITQGFLDGSVKLPIDNFFLDTPGFVLEGLALVTVILFVHLVWSCHRVRQLSTAIAILGHMPRANADDWHYEDDPILTTISPSRQLDIAEEILVTQEQIKVIHDLVSPYVLYGLFLMQCIAIIAICHWRFQRRDQDFNWGIHSRLYLKLLSEKCCQMIYLDKYLGNPQDFVATAPVYISGLRVHGIWWPQLFFSWEGIRISNTINGQTHVLTGAYTIPWRTAWVLRRHLLAERYIATLVLHGQQFTAINLAVAIGVTE